MSGDTTAGRALIHSIYEPPASPERIEARSFAAIDAELPDHGFAPERWVIVRRMIHTTANFALARDVRFSEDAVDSAVEALSDGAGIYVDSNMIRSGISIERLRVVNPGYAREKIACHVADADVAAEAKKARLPRSLFAVRKAREMIDGGIAVFGNAPVALLELNRMIIEDGVKPRLVIAAPVGFVHVVESKEELMSLGVPHITLSGRFGGSPLAVSVIHSLCAIAVDRKGVSA